MTGKERGLGRREALTPCIPARRGALGSPPNRCGALTASRSSGQHNGATARALDGAVPVAALHTACDSQEQAVALVRKASAFLAEESSDLKRRYSLRDDMARNGQEHTGIAVLHELSWLDPASGGRHTRTVLARVLGNSRAAVRLDLLGLNAVEAAFGVPVRLLRGAPAASERAGELSGPPRPFSTTRPRRGSP